MMNTGLFEGALALLEDWNAEPFREGADTDFSSVGLSGGGEAVCARERC